MSFYKAGTSSTTLKKSLEKNSNETFSICGNQGVNFNDFFQNSHLSTNPLYELCTKNKDLKRLIVNLFPLENGYSLMFKTSTGHCMETKSLPYEEYEILDYIDNEEVCNIVVAMM